MDHIDYPVIEKWEARRDWFEAQFDIERRGGGYILGEHAVGLLVDLQSVYCVGAYITCVILACTIIDAHLREVEFGPEFDGGIEAAFSSCQNREDLDWLRRRRNELVHFKIKRGSVISVDDQWEFRGRHKEDAERSIRVLAEILFESPFV
jgi:hypothetical protein